MLNKKLKQLHKPPTPLPSTELATADTDTQLNLYFTLFEKLADPVMLIKDDHFISCNVASLNLLGYPDKATFFSQSPWAISPEFQADGLNSKEKSLAMNALAQQQGHHRFNWQHLRYDNEIITVEVTLTAISLVNEALLHVAWRDITETTKIQQTLRESILRWKFALEGSGDGVWDWNIETNNAIYSKRWKEMLGYSEHDIQPTNQEWQMRIYPSDQAMVASTMQAYLEGITPIYRVEYRLKCKDDSYKWILGRGMVVKRDLQGQPLRMIGTHTDITQLKETELILQQALFDAKQAESQVKILSLALEQSQSAVMITDLNDKIDYVNQAFITNSGYARENLIGQSPNRFKSDKTPNSTYETMWATLEDGKAWQGELITLNKQGKEFVELTWISPIRQDDGMISHYLAVKEDITERKKTEALLWAAKERAESLAKAKSQFLANMSHEIRTPMTAIIGLSDLALLEELPQKTYDYLQNIHDAAKHLFTILNDILDVSKLETGLMTLQLQHFKLTDIKATLQGLFINVAQTKGLTLIIDIESKVPDTLIGDSQRLRQVLINLLGNAIKFTQQGTVTLSINLLQLDATEARLLFAVTDTGIGISTKQQERLFKAFSQVDDSYARNFEGTGLGLVISQDLVQLMDGFIKVESTLGSGSCFSFELALPLVDVSTIESLIIPPTLSPETLKGARILVVEDEAINQIIINEVLKLFGASVVLANNGLEALAALEQQTIDIVLMDLHMPIMNGYEATIEIRKQVRYAQLPVIAFSASVTEEDKQQCLDIGMNDCVGKPINKIELLATLQLWLKR